MTTINELKDILLRLQTPNTEVVMGATNQLKSFLRNKESLPLLFEIFQSDQNPILRQSAGVNLKAAVIKQWLKSDDSVRTSLAQSIYNILLTEPLELLRRAAADVLCTIFRIALPVRIMDPSQFWSIVSDLANSDSMHHVASAIYIVTLLSEHLHEHYVPKYQDLVSLTNALLDPKYPLSIRIQACTMFGAVVYTLDEEDEATRYFAPLIIPIANTIQACIESGIDEVTECFGALENVLESAPEMLDGYIESFVQLLAGIGLTNEIDWDIRESALTLVQTSLQIKPSWFVKKQLLSNYIDMAFRVGLESRNDDETQQKARIKYAGHLIEALSRYIQPKLTYSQLLNTVQQLSSSDDYVEKKMALTALTNIAYGYSELLYKDLNTIVPYIVSCFSDQRVDIKRQTCILLGKFAEHLKPTIFEYQSTLIPCMLNVLNESHPTLQESAMYSLLSYVENIKKADLEVFMDPILKVLVNILMQSKSSDIREMAITTISAVAVAAKDLFAPYFEHIMAIVKDLASYDGQDGILLKARAIDAAGTIALVVGKEAFFPYCEHFVKIAFNSVHLETTYNYNDSEVFYKVKDLKECIYSFLGNLAETLGPDYLPFLEPTIQLAIDSLSSEDNAEYDQDVLNQLLDDEDRKQLSSTEDVFTQSLKQALGSGDIEEKLCALQCVGTVAGAVGAPFLPYISKCSEIISKLSLSFYASARKLSIFAIEKFLLVIDSAYPPAKRGWEPGMDVAEYMPSKETLEALDIYLRDAIDRIPIDPDSSVVGRHIEFISFVLTTFGAPGIYHHYESVLHGVLVVLKEDTTCQETILSELDNEEYVQDAIYLYEHATDLVGYLAVAYREQFYNSFEHFLVPLAAVIESEDHYKLQWRHYAIGAICVALENVDVPSLPRDHILIYLPQALKHMGDEDDDYLRQNAVYLLGILISSPHLFSMYEKILERLLITLTQDPFRNCVNNACGVLGRAILASVDNVPVGAIMEYFLEQLPIIDDPVEEVPTYSAILYLIKNKHPDISPFIPTIFKLMVGVIGNPNMDPQLRVDLIYLIQHIRKEYSHQVETIITQFTAEEQQSMENALNYQ